MDDNEVVEKKKEMAGKPGSTTTTTTMMTTMMTTTTTFLAVMSVLVVVLAVLVRGEVTQKEGGGTLSSVASTSSPSSSSSSSSSSSPAAAAPAVVAATEDYESIDVNASSASEARGTPPPPPAPAAAAASPRPGTSDVGCRGLRSKRYISDGFCRTLKPISEVLCTGYCVPERYMPWYPEFMQIWGRAKVMEYRCVDGVVRNQNIRLMCDNGKMRVYKVRVVKSCACRKHVRPPSTSLLQPPPLNQPHLQHHQQLPSSASNVSALAAEAGARAGAGAGKIASKKHNRQRHHGKKRTVPPAEKNA